MTYRWGDVLAPPRSDARREWEGLTCPNYPGCIEQHLIPLPDTCTKHARWNQLPPDGDWIVWFIRGGRGSGKTRPGAQTLAAMIEDAPGKNEWACVGPTFADARDTMIESQRSGLLLAMGLPRNYRGWNRSQGQLWLPDGGSVVFCDGADDGAYRIQGKNLSAIWADEIGLWKKWAIAWDESIGGAVRIGDNVRRIATGTPKRGHPLVKQLLADPTVAKSHLRTRDNIANLSEKAVADLERKWGGTSFGAQELEGELLDEAEGALWTFDEAKASSKGLIRYGTMPTHPRRIGTFEFPEPDLLLTIEAVDPAISSSGDEWGVIILALAADGNIYVRGDRSAQCSPEEAGKRIVQAYDDFGVDWIVYEDNQGGEMVKLVIDTVRRNLPTKPVRAYQGKQLRADSVQAAYQQGRVLHLKNAGLELLESQMIGWEPLAGMPSPDRLDALVHGIREIDSRASGKVEQGRSPWA